MIGSGFRVMLAFLVIQRPQQLEKESSSSLLSLCFSWHSFVRWRAIVLDYEILGMRSLRSLRVFQLSFAHALTRGASLVAASPGRGPTPLHRAALEGHVEVVALLLKSGASVEATDDSGRRPQSRRSHGNCVGEESR